MEAMAEIVRLVQQAVQSNGARQNAIAEHSIELRPGVVPRGWITGDHGLEEIRRSLDRAEKLLRKLIEADLEDEGMIRVWIPGEFAEAILPLQANSLHDEVIERIHRRLNASWSYVDLVSWEPLIRPDETPILFLLIRLPLGKPQKGHMAIGEEHNLSGVHFHYTKLDGRRSDVIFAFGDNAPEPAYPLKWERHGKGKAKFHPSPEVWNWKKRANINEVCCAARLDLPSGTRFFTPSKEARFLLPM